VQRLSEIIPRVVADKHVLLAALTYNLKKLMQFSRKSPQIAIQTLHKNETIRKAKQNLQNTLFLILK
jgi:hypothetical protein